MEPVEGGWVSYVDPQQYPKAHFGETKPYFAPHDVSTLHGPDSGVVKLPLTIYWGPDRWFNLSRRSPLRHAYHMILEEGTIEEMNLYLNCAVLLSIWNDLTLPPRLSYLWEHKVEGLTHA